MSSPKIKLLVLCPFPIGEAAGQRLKYEQYFADWQSLGYTIEVSAFMDLAMWNLAYKQGNYIKKFMGFLRGQTRRYKDLFRVADYDVVYIHMWVTPLGTSIFERLVRKLSKKLIFDVEDNVILEFNQAKETDNPNRWISFLKGPWKARYLIKNADHVITSSPFLNDLCIKINLQGASTYISSSVDTERFVPKNCYSNATEVVVGWTGTFSSKGYLDTLRPVFLELSGRYRFKLKIIGNFDYELPGVDLEVVRWTKDSEVSDLQSIDIGVYPLIVDDWVLGKSGLKAIQYMAFGLPIVATRVGTTPLLISNEVDGLLVESREEWVSALERLLLQPELRRRLGESAREKAVKFYSLSAIKHDYRRVLQQTTKKEEYE